MITYTDQHLPGIQLLSANVIKCSLFAFKVSYQTGDMLLLKSAEIISERHTQSYRFSRLNQRFYGLGWEGVQGMKRGVVGGRNHKASPIKEKKLNKDLPL